MKTKNKADIAIIGAGIVGLAHAYAAAKRGLKVVVFERTQKAIGASVRNFGLIWPIGQAPGHSYQRALVSRGIYLDLAPKAGFWLNQNGAIHLAYHPDEFNVLEEFYEKSKELGFDCDFIRSDFSFRNNIIKTDGLKGALYSKTELTVDPREIISKLPAFLEKEYQVKFRFGTAVTNIDVPYVNTFEEEWRTEKIFICSGADFETLYPEVFASTNITKCKLQMMRTSAQSSNWKLGPTLCAGLTLLHYAAFRHCESLSILKERSEKEYPEFLKWGIHVLLAQNGLGELIIGDSHEYSLNPEPFDKEFINQLIIDYLQTFVNIPDLQITERWHGIYPKLEGQTEFIAHPEKNVIIVNGLGGAGMTLSFGLAEENMTKLLIEA
ncbi:TIGR03364 family FAD-dependent oxidoreductase [soil metagenome]